MLKTVKPSDITGGREIAAGGEGKIHEDLSSNNKVIKVYHKPRDTSFQNHLEKLSKLLSDKFVKPIDIYTDNRTKQTLGFSMSYVNFNDYWLFNNLFNKGFCTANNFDKSFKFQILAQLAKELVKLHNDKIIIGDLNQYNLFFNKKGDILFVDVDSYQTADNQHSGVLLDDIRDWTTNDINDKTDIWAYDILAFWASTYCHPFKWVVPGNKEPLEMRVRAGKSYLSKIPGIKIPALYEPFSDTGGIHKQYIEIFSGRRYIVSLDGAPIFVPPVIKQSMVSKDLSIRKLYSSVTEVHATNKFFSFRRGSCWVLVEASVPKVTREITIETCDELFPSDSQNYAIRTGNILNTAILNWGMTFIQPIFSYNDGSLIVIDYGNDMQWNFNINNQLVGIDNTNQPVFAKSIIKRSGLIQNFGSQKYINVPNLNRYSLINIHKESKDAIYSRGYTGMEIKGKKNTEFRIRQEDQEHVSYFGYLPHFAVINKNTILVPEDGYIDIYYNMQPAGRFDCTVCSRDSKLYHTLAGILLFENNTLYLLNTK